MSATARMSTSCDMICSKPAKVHEYPEVSFSKRQNILTNHHHQERYDVALWYAELEKWRNKGRKPRSICPSPTLKTPVFNQTNLNGVFVGKLCSKSLLPITKSTKRGKVDKPPNEPSYHTLHMSHGNKQYFLKNLENTITNICGKYLDGDWIIAGNRQREASLIQDSINQSSHENCFPVVTVIGTKRQIGNKVQ